MLISPVLRAFLIIAASLTLFFVLSRIRKSQMKTADGIFWFFFVLCLVLLAVFPQVASWFSDALGIESPSNFIFLAILAILLIREFTASLEIAKLKAKLSLFVQDEALRNSDVLRRGRCGDDDAEVR